MPNRAVAQRFMVDGPSVERSILRRDCNLLVAKLVKDAPADKYSTVRRLLADARAGKIDREVFKEFVRRTNSFSLVEEIFNWEKYQKEVR
jgi:hypothetical protein